MPKPNRVNAELRTQHYSTPTASSFQTSVVIIDAAIAELSLAGRVTNHRNSNALERGGKTLLEAGGELLNLGIELVSSLLDVGLNLLL